MNFFSISDIENLTNIKAHTLRIWEQRYGLCFSKRKDSSHRYYDAEDLKQMLRIAWLYHRGHKISKIATLNAEEIRRIAHGETSAEKRMDHYFNRLFEASLDLDETAFTGTLQISIREFGFETAIKHLVFPFLEKMGLFWLTGHVIPAQEHFASELIIRRIMTAIQEIPIKSLPDRNKEVVLFNPEGELHEIPLLYMHYLLRKNRIPVAYFGCSTSIGTLQEYCQLKSPARAYFHLITNLTRKDISVYLAELSAALPRQRIFCSGCCVEELTATPSNVIILRGEKEIDGFSEMED